MRGAGFMLGLVCKLPNLDVINAAFEQEMLTVPAGDNVVRLLPSLTLSEAEIAEGIDRLDRAATALKAQTHDAAE